MLSKTIIEISMKELSFRGILLQKSDLEKIAEKYTGEKTVEAFCDYVEDMYLDNPLPSDSLCHTCWHAFVKSNGEHIKYICSCADSKKFQQNVSDEQPESCDAYDSDDQI